MLSREIIAVCSQIHTKHVNTLCGQNSIVCLCLTNHPVQDLGSSVVVELAM